VLMEPNRIKLIVPNGEGGSIYGMKHADGFANLHTFLEWWIAQDDAVRLEGFMAQHFPGRFDRQLLSDYSPGPGPTI
jgi:hypothetical protein